MANKKRTSEDISDLAARVLADDRSSETAKKLAGSALAQTRTSKQTGSELEDLASMVLKSSKYSKDTKKLAGSVLSQSNKKR